MLRMPQSSDEKRKPKSILFVFFLSILGFFVVDKFILSRNETDKQKHFATASDEDINKASENLVKASIKKNQDTNSEPISDTEVKKRAKQMVQAQLLVRNKGSRQNSSSARTIDQNYIGPNDSPESLIAEVTHASDNLKNNALSTKAPLLSSDSRKSPIMPEPAKFGHIDCRKFHLNYAIDAGALSSDGKFYYLLARTGSLVDYSSPMHRALYKINLYADTIQQVFSTDTSGRGILITHGENLYGISYLRFSNASLVSDASLTCAFGQARGESIVLEKTPRYVKSFEAANYQVISTDTDRAVIDLSSGAIVEFDPSSLQKRKDTKIPKGLFALYLDQQSKRIFAFDPAKDGGLVRYTLGTETIEEKLFVQEGHYLLQQNGKFAVARYLEEVNRLEITEDAHWGVRAAHLSITLPKHYKINEAAVIVDLASNTALIHGKVIKKYARRWDKIFIWDLQKDQLLSSTNIEDEYFTAHAAFSQLLNRYIVVLYKRSNDIPNQFLTFDLDKENWNKTKFPEQP